MGSVCDLSELPTEYSRKIIDGVIEGEMFKDYHTSISLASKKGENYLGELYRINVNGRKINGETGSVDLVLKLSPNDPLTRQHIPINRFYSTEVYAYTKLIPKFYRIQNDFKIPIDRQFKTAKCYKASSEEPNEFIVMEDLCAQGFVMYDRLKTLDYEHLTISMKNLAALHALSFVMIEREPALMEKMASDCCKSADFGIGFKKMFEHCFRQSIKAMDDDVCAQKLQDCMDDHFNKMCKYLDPETAAPYNIICHGDCWSNNFLFRYEETHPVEMRTIDWQILRYASPVTDISYLLFTSTDEQTRSKYYPAILNVYYDTLGDRLAAMDCDVGKCYPKEVFLDHVKRILPYGLLLSIIILPLTQCDRDRPADIADMMENDSQSTLSENCMIRIRGVVRDFIKYGML